MKLSQKKLLDILLESSLSVNELSEYFDIIVQLSFNYGVVLFSQEFLSIISSQNKIIWDLLIILKRIKCISQKDLKSFHRFLLNHKDYDLTFTLQFNDKNIREDIHNYLNEKFGKVDIFNKPYEWDWVKIKWWDWYFKKDMDQDINKILGLE